VHGYHVSLLYHSISHRVSPQCGLDFDRCAVGERKTSRFVLLNMMAETVSYTFVLQSQLRSRLSEGPRAQSAGGSDTEDDTGGELWKVFILENNSGIIPPFTSELLSVRELSL
jgi:hypothetical protein